MFVSSKLQAAHCECGRISGEERKNEKTSRTFVGFVRGLDSGSEVPDQRADETDPKHSIAEC